MNRAHFLVASAFLFFVLSACQELQSGEQEFPPYNPTTEDIVATHGDIENLERFHQFIENIKNDIADEIRIVRYTTEGDPIIQDVNFDGEMIETTLDSRRDSYGSGSLDTTTCQSIKVEEKAERTDYLLTDCKQPNIDNLILVVHKD